MKAPVLKRFKDKVTKEIYIKGIYEGTEERVKELQIKGFLGDAVEDENDEPSVLEGNVSEVKKVVTKELGKEQLNALLDEEESGENRKGVKDHITSVLAEIEEEGE